MKYRHFSVFAVCVVFNPLCPVLCSTLLYCIHFYCFICSEYNYQYQYDDDNDNDNGIVLWSVCGVMNRHQSRYGA